MRSEAAQEVLSGNDKPHQVFLLKMQKLEGARHKSLVKGAKPFELPLMPHIFTPGPDELNIVGQSVQVLQVLANHPTRHVTPSSYDSRIECYYPVSPRGQTKMFGLVHLSRNGDYKNEHEDEIDANDLYSRGLLTLEKSPSVLLNEINEKIRRDIRRKPVRCMPESVETGPTIAETLGLAVPTNAAKKRRLEPKQVPGRSSQVRRPGEEVISDVHVDHTTAVFKTVRVLRKAKLNIFSEGQINVELQLTDFGFRVEKNLGANQPDMHANDVIVAIGGKPLLRLATENIDDQLYRTSRSAELRNILKPPGRDINPREERIILGSITELEQHGLEPVRGVLTRYLARLEGGAKGENFIR